MREEEPMPHSYERRSMEYEKWIKMLDTILLNRFGICSSDSFDEEQLKGFFSNRDSPADIAGDLKYKRELIELKTKFARN